MAITLSLMLLFSVFFSIRKEKISLISLHRVKEHRRDICVSLILIASVLFIAGLTGNWRQHSDYPIRNDIFIDLITKSWPPSLPDGKYFIYYFQSWLPASLVGAVAGWKAAQWAYYIWMFIGCSFVLYYLYRAIGRISFWIALTFLVWNGLELIPCSLIAPITRDTTVSLAFSEANHVATPYICFGPAFSLRSISHCFVPIAIICGMSLKPFLLEKWGVFLGICAVLYSPMAAIFLLPCLAYLYLKPYGFRFSDGKKVFQQLMSPLSITSYLLFALVIVPFYLSANSASPFTLERVNSLSVFALIFYLFWNVGIGAMLTRWHNKDNLLWFALLSHALCMLASLCVNTDMAMKGSAICNFFLLVLFLKAAYSAPKAHRIYYILYIIVASSYMVLVVGAGKVAILTLVLYLFLHFSRRLQLACVVTLSLILASVLFIKPSVFVPLQGLLFGNKQRYSKNIGIYQADGGSGRWWWYKTFPDKEIMPVWFKIN